MSIEASSANDINPSAKTPTKRAKGPNKFRLAEVLPDGAAQEGFWPVAIDMRATSIFPSAAAVRDAATKRKRQGQFCAVLIRDRFTVAVETPEPVPVVTVKSVKV